MKKIVICGGHLTPALALIEELRSKDRLKESVKIYFFGRKYSTEGSKSYSAEYQVITKNNIEFIEIVTGRLQRKFTRYTILSLLKIPLGFLQSFYFLLRIRPSLIVSFGSYVSSPIVFTGWLLGIDSITHEQAVVPGLANKFNALFVKKVFLTWSQTKVFFDPSKTEVIGNLLRTSIFKTVSSNTKIKKFLQNSQSLVFVTGGNQGSHFINQLIFKTIDKLDQFSVLHQLGTANFKKDHLQAQQIKKQNYLPVTDIDPDDIGSILSKSLLVISRSGANTVWELATVAKPAILIPLPASASGEQQANAKILEKAGSAVILKQEVLTHEIFIKTVQNMSRNLSKYQKGAHQLAKFFPKDAAKILTRFIYTNY
ncbi:UDP-N-acetylglucosamine--N-acetylmuramyl-(pentapeptide) pyrophosphoryl-undecaprenol N-acetylglucosamine transferase [Candidatus Curtissbacteria bacterium]|nr:UDP-N-acetylglucosamine--N-acetylmuramyl-(pentapeptide) pyrophosphoryl-undecaprenol N-acetylglucosamine transferase [Candidatus Curtissbacteria bacterium]